MVRGRWHELSLPILFLEISLPNGLDVTRKTYQKVKKEVLKNTIVKEDNFLPLKELKAERKKV